MNRIFFRVLLLTGVMVCLSLTSAQAEAGREVILRLHGSNTIGAKLAPDLAEVFLKKLGASKINKADVSLSDKPSTEFNIEGYFTENNLTRVIEIKAHGSSEGFQALRDNLCDIAMASRKIKSEEVAQLARFGDMTSDDSEHVLGLDGIAVIVNMKNSTTQMDVGKVADIFSGKITDWSQTGGSSAPITVHARDNNSGTHDTFKSLVLGKNALISSAVRYDSNPSLSQAVSQNIHAIGYCGLPYVESNRAIAVSDGGAAIRPTAFTIATEDYPLARRLHLYTPATPTNPYTQSFISFALSPEGQALVEKHKFVCLKITETEYRPETNIPINNQKVVKKYLNAVKSAKRLSLNIRFRAGQSVPDTKAKRDMERIIEFLNDKKLKGRRIILVGFSDGVGKYQTNYNTALKRAKNVESELRSRGIKVHQVLSGGQEMPVASNDSPERREKNRRVEVWIK